MLSGRTQRRALPRHQSEEMKINLVNISSPRMANEHTTSRFHSHTLCRCATTGLYLMSCTTTLVVGNKLSLQHRIRNQIRSYFASQLTLLSVASISAIVLDIVTIRVLCLLLKMLLYEMKDFLFMFVIYMF